MDDSVALAVCLLLACGCAPSRGPSPEGGSEPRLVAPGVVSTLRHENFPAIDPVDGSLWFSVYHGEAFNRQTLAFPQTTAGVRARRGSRPTGGRCTSRPTARVRRGIRAPT